MSINTSPLGWTSCYLGDVASVINGFAFKSSDYSDEGVAVIRISDINGGIVSSSSSKRIEKREGFDAYHVNSDDILIAMSGATTGKFGIFHSSEVAYLNQRVGNLKPISERSLKKKFLFYLLHNLKRDIEEKAYGGAQPNISSKQIESLPIALPPLNEQHRIVAKIEELFSELDKGIESLTTAKAQLQVYRQSLLKHAFEGKLTEQWRKDHQNELESADELLARIQDEREARYQQQVAEWQESVKQWEENGKERKKPSKPKKNNKIYTEDILPELPSLPDSWSWFALGDMNIDIFDGPFGSNLKTSDYVNEGIRVIRLENIGNQKFINDKKSFISTKKYELLRKHTVYPGDIIFSSFVTGAIRAAIVPNEIPRAVNKADCFCIRLFGEQYDPQYLESYLASYDVFKRIEQKVHGVGRPRINTTQLKEVLVPICSSTEQREINSILNEKFSVIDHIEIDIEHSLQKSESLRQSILKKAFSGQLVSQDPNDEPASELLKRIAVEKAELEAQAKQAKAATRKPRKKTTAA